MSALLEVDQLEVNFGGRVSAVRGASVTVERGETIAWWANRAAANP